MVWSLARQRCKDKVTISTLAEDAEKSLRRSSSPREISNFAWAFGKLRLLRRPLMDAVGAAVVPRPAEFEPRQISTIAWACAKSRYTNKELLERLSWGAVKRSSEFAAQDISNMVWAYATLAVFDRPLIEALCGEARLGEFATQGISNLVWALAKVRYSGKAPLESSAEQVLLQVRGFED